MGLTVKQQRFARELPTAPSKAEAARRAGYTKKNARQAAQDVLTSPYIGPAIAQEQAKVEALVKMSREEWQADMVRESRAGDLGQPNSARIQALRTIGEACGWLKRDVVVSIDNIRLVDALLDVASDYVDPGKWLEFARRVDDALRRFG